MSHTFNDARRDKFPKAKYQVTDCVEYNESLRRRRDVTIWVSDDVVQNWTSPRRKTRGGQSRYSDLAVEICLTQRGVFRLPLRQTQGFMRSIATLMGIDLVVPDFSTLSRHGNNGWQIETGSNQSSQVEAQIGSWKQAIGDRLQARDFDCQIAVLSSFFSHRRFRLRFSTATSRPNSHSCACSATDTFRSGLPDLAEQFPVPMVREFAT